MARPGVNVTGFAAMAREWRLKIGVSIRWPSRRKSLHLLMRSAAIHSHGTDYSFDMAELDPLGDLASVPGWIVPPQLA